MELFINSGNEEQEPSQLFLSSFRPIAYVIAIKVFKAIAYCLIIL